jgi:copper chaperone NosL
MKLHSLAFLFLLAACSEPSANAQNARCELCGMRIEPDSGWRSGGASLRFDSPKCLFRYRHERGEVREPWMIEYYTQRRRPAEGLFYVIGSDLEGPMGRDLVPVEGREAAERLRRDHHGDRVLSYAEVTREVAASLFGSR